MKMLGFLLILCYPVHLLAQADTVRVGWGQHSFLMEESVFEFQPAPLYGYTWNSISQLPKDSWQVRRNRNLIFPSNGKAVALRFWVKNETALEQPVVF